MLRRGASGARTRGVRHPFRQPHRAGRRIRPQRRGVPRTGRAGIRIRRGGDRDAPSQAGNPRPRVFRLPKDNAIINRIGLANRGLEATIRHLPAPARRRDRGLQHRQDTSTPAENAPADYLKLFRSLYQYADYFTVNISCDNACREGTTHTREHILQILNPLFDFRRGQNQFRPIMLKISPDMSDEVIDQITDVLLETPLDGIVATNGTHSRGGLHTSRTTLEKIGSGRLSGAPLTHRAVEIVRRVHTRSGGTYPIIGVGGLMSAGDVRRCSTPGPTSCNSTPDTSTTVPEWSKRCAAN